MTVCSFGRVQSTDHDLQKLIKLTELSKADGYVIKNGLLYRNLDDSLLLVPKTMQTQIIQQAHGQDHFGVNKTEALIHRNYWFKGMRPKIEKIVTICINCIQAERNQGKQEEFLNVIDKGDVSLDTYYIDHLGLLLSIKKKILSHFPCQMRFLNLFGYILLSQLNVSDVIDRLRKQSVVFRNPQRIISWYRIHVQFVSRIL